MDKLDARIAALSRDVLPQQPYLMSFPSERPYRKSSSIPERWYVNTPFDRKEGPMQYMSMLQHTDEPLLRADGTRISEAGILLPRDSIQPIAPISTPQTPSLAGNATPKRKITLADYKNKSALNTPERKEDHNGPQSLRRQAIKSHKEEVEKQVDEVRKEDTITNDVAVKQQKAEQDETEMNAKVHIYRQKSPPVSSLNTEFTPSNIGGPTKRDSSTNRPVKRRRLSSDDMPDHRILSRLEVKKTEVKRELPALLSPERPKEEERKEISPRPQSVTPQPLRSTQKSMKRALPPLLSPTLPASLAKAIQTPKKSEEVNRLPKPTLGSPAGPYATDDTPTRPRTGNHLSIQSAAPASSPAGKISPGNGSRTNTPLPVTGTDSPRRRQMHRIKLKFKKASGKRRYRELVRLCDRKKPVTREIKTEDKTVQKAAPTQGDSSEAGIARNPKKLDLNVESKARKYAERATESGEDDMGDGAERSRRKIDSSALQILREGFEKATSTKPEKKRLSEMAEESKSTKRLKTDSNSESPAKIEQKVNREPDISRSSPVSDKSKEIRDRTKGVLLATPRRDIKSVAMQRVASTETNGGATTPKSGSRVTGEVDRQASQASQVKALPAVMNTSDARGGKIKDGDEGTWQNLQLRVFSLGRTLKKEVTEQAASLKPGEKPSPGCVLTAIEALLCFMVSQAANAQSGQEPDWHSMLGYLGVTHNYARSYPHLRGLVFLLGTICRQQLQMQLMLRLRKEQFHEPDNVSTSDGSVPTPGSDGATKTSRNDNVVCVNKSFVRLRNDIVENDEESRRAWQAGSQVLNRHSLEQSYPRTWAAGSLDYRARSFTNPDIRDLGKYFVPLEDSSTVLEAVAFAKAVLDEWAESENVNWQGRLEFQTMRSSA